MKQHIKPTTHFVCITSMKIQRCHLIYLDVCMCFYPLSHSLLYVSVHFRYILYIWTVYRSEFGIPRTPSLQTAASRPSRARWGANTTSSLRRVLRWWPRATATRRRRIISRTITWLAQANPRAGDTLEDRGLQEIKLFDFKFLIRQHKTCQFLISLLFFSTKQAKNLSWTNNSGWTQRTGCSAEEAAQTSNVSQFD